MKTIQITQTYTKTTQHPIKRFYNFIQSPITYKIKNNNSNETSLNVLLSPTSSTYSRSVYRVTVATDRFQWYTLSMNPLDEGSVRRRDLYLTICNTHKSQISMPLAGFRTHGFDRATIGFDYRTIYKSEICFTVLVYLLRKYVSLHSEFAAIAHPAEGRAKF